MNTYSEFHKFMREEHGLTLLDSEIQEIIYEAKKVEDCEWLKKFNSENPQSIQLMQYKIMNKLSENLINQLENLFIQGLKNKGFEFKNKIELENFIKKRCRKEDYIEFKKNIYYVDEIPFLIHYYEVVFEPITEYNNGIEMTANYGKYAFV